MGGSGSGGGSRSSGGGGGVGGNGSAAPLPSMLPSTLPSKALSSSSSSSSLLWSNLTSHVERLSFSAKEVARRMGEDNRMKLQRKSRRRIQEDEEKEKERTTTATKQQKKKTTTTSRGARNNYGTSGGGGGGGVPHAHIRLGAASRMSGSEDRRTLRVRAASESDDEDAAAADAAADAAEREAEKERTTRERGWNDTVGSPARGSTRGKPPLFSANLDTQSVPSGKKRRTRKKITKQRGGITSGKSTFEVRSDGLVSISPDNPAWVGAGRRTSMFGLPRTNSVQQNRRGTILTPASEVFNER